MGGLMHLEETVRDDIVIPSSGDLAHSLSCWEILGFLSGPSM